MSFVAPSVSTGTAPRPNGGAAILTCSKCGGHRSKRSLSGLCFKCSMAARKPAQRHCERCEKPIHIRTRGELCYRCLQADPEFQARRLAGVRKTFENPEHRAKMARVVARNHAKARLRPEFAEWLSAHGKHLAQILQSPEIKAKMNTPEFREKLGRAVSEARVGWCPPEFRDEYRSLIRSKRMASSKARAIIEEKVANLDALKDVDSALDYLRKFAPVQKLENGYRYGNAVLTPAEVVSRARTRGWEPESWAA